MAAFWGYWIFGGLVNQTFFIQSPTRLPRTDNADAQHRRMISTLTLFVWQAGGSGLQPHNLLGRCADPAFGLGLTVRLQCLADPPPCRRLLN